MPELQRLQRTPFARATGQKIAGIFLYKMCMKEKPYITPTWMDNEKNEWWDVERQFFLKFKNEFQKFGFMPVGRSFIKEQF